MRSQRGWLGRALHRTTSIERACMITLRKSPRLTRVGEHADGVLNADGMQLRGTYPLTLGEAGERDDTNL